LQNISRGLELKHWYEQNTSSPFWYRERICQLPQTEHLAISFWRYTIDKARFSNTVASNLYRAI